MASSALLVNVQQLEAMRFREMLVEIARSVESCFVAKLAGNLRRAAVDDLRLLLDMRVGADAVNLARVKVNLNQLIHRVFQDYREVFQALVFRLFAVVFDDHVDDRILVEISQNRREVNFVRLLVMTDEGELADRRGEIEIAEITQHDALLPRRILDSIQPRRRLTHRLLVRHQIHAVLVPQMIFDVP